MTLDKFGKHTYSTMTLDRFGKHIHGHIVLKHLDKPEVLDKSINDRWNIIQKTLNERLKNLELQEHTPQVLSLYGDGRTDDHGFCLIKNKMELSSYKNQIYSGKIFSIISAGRVFLYINGNPTKNLPFPVNIGDELQIRQEQEPDKPHSGQNFYMEILIKQ